MSRVIVKGLPIYLKEDRLRDLIEKRLTHKHQSTDVKSYLSDVKLMKNRDGESRRFAFIGFRDEEDAFDCVSYFNGTYVDTSKIEVSMAKSFADPRVPQPMREKRREALKRLREREELLLADNKDSGKKQKPSVESGKKHDIDAEIAKNKQLQEFIDTMKPSSQITSWETVQSSKDVDVDEEAGDASGEVSSNPLLSHALALKGNSGDDDEDADMFKIPGNASDDEYTSLDAANGGRSTEESDPQMMSLDAFDASANPPTSTDDTARDEGVSDLDWLKNRRVRIKDGADTPVSQQRQGNEQHSEEVETRVEEPVEVEDKETQEEKALKKIKDTGRLFLRNILYTAAEDDFRKLFSTYGELEEVHVAVDTRTGQSKGFAYVLFKNPDNAATAYVELDKQIFQGRLLHILPAEEKKNHKLDEFDLKNLPLKKQRELKRKANSAQHTFAWNSLYMNQDAVLSSVADKLGMKKSELIDAESSSSAVKQALAEASVIGDVRKYFETRGVDLTKFGQLKNSERDDRVILVKNFPYGTTREEIAELFLPFGKLQRLLLPPSGTIAILQFRDIPAARAAFSKISFKRFKDGIIYLEKGPSDCFTRDAQGDELVDSESDILDSTAKEAKISGADLLEAPSQAADDAGPDDDDDLPAGPTVSIFIKNLNFSTTSQQLAEKFKHFNGFVVAQVKTKPDPKNSDKTLSMGFGFAEFKTKEQANAVISALEGTVLDGHKLQLKLSHRQGTSSASALSSKKKKKNQGKIIVKNLPFEATRKDVFELFSSFGQLKSVRVPKKFDKSARGFAFVEFLLPKEAENAMDQLQGVHLLGRRLVMEFVDQDSEDVEQQIEKMTKKVKKQVNTTKIASMRNSGKRKLDLDEDDENDGLQG
ncbi:unnamed protein product [Kluyveromyces dobzhanskii CBS 2104]|uniref:Multiple RNA-binding domain-containing protein 1 n=1 Tax=Kluyveromyces dobzhanskii CBS 2104 TaxID=1427455 RepID=A0A0A8L4V3_9SACH|nr:unnamed protein product [Kluyveromyces dobzhanskii CBS 2104]